MCSLWKIHKKNYSFNIYIYIYILKSVKPRDRIFIIFGYNDTCVAIFGYNNTCVARSKITLNIFVHLWTVNFSEVIFVTQVVGHYVCSISPANIS
jgi:hypothetical protein